ncbi:MAG: 4Fe-4S ferredoxin [bacterium]|nr:4Fe-4S ferredoxin [bacterium]
MADFQGCPGAAMVDFSEEESNDTQTETNVKIESQLRQWPIQMHLIQPTAPYYQKKDVLLVADCVAFAIGDFHNDFLKGKSLAIACPKLDEGQDVYLEKVKSWLDDAEINTLTVMIMQVPCCSGLLYLAQQAAGQAKRKVPVKSLVVSLQGEILSEEWVSS